MKKGRPVFIFLVLLILLSAVYAPVFTSYYAHHDDYVYFVREQNRLVWHPFWNGEFSLGRYLVAIFYTLSGWAVDSVDDLNLLRFMSIVILVLCGLTCFTFFYKYLMSDLQALLLTVSLLTLPSFQVFVSGALNMNKAIAFLFACAAFSVADGKLRDRPLSLKATAAVYGRAVFLFLCALSAYPPGAMFYWFLLALWIMGERPGIPAVRLFVLHFFVVGLVSMGAYFGIVQTLKSTFGTLTDELYNPYMITADYFGKIFWFLREPLVNAVNLWNIFPSARVTFFILLIVLVGVFLRAFRAYKEYGENPSLRPLWKHLFINLLLIVFLLFLSFSPNLLTVGNAAFYRCSVALTSIVFIIFIWAVMKIVDLFPEAMRRNIITMVLLSAAFYGAYNARSNIVNYRIVPSHRELVYVKARLRRPDLYKFHHVHFIRPDETAYEKIKRYDEFGVPSTYYPQDIPLILKCALREIGLEPFFWYFYPRITQGGPLKHPLPSDVLVIDMTKMETFD